MPAPEVNLEKLSLNSVPNWFTKSSTPGGGSYNLAAYVGAHGLESISQVDVRVVGSTMTYESVGGGAISLADSEWAYIPLFNGLDKIDVTIAGGDLEVICWGASKGQ